ncbi:nuclear transport factor 2 family protein [Buchananella felis]|uniref:nuclear transport factor 2 family protein n=1 Tax=Buchananella felis TaxID=3231492 RepID=UPI003528716D
MRDALAQFFAAENRRDWNRYAAFLHPEVEWRLGGDIIQGREAYLRRIQAAYAGSSATFRAHQLLPSADGQTVAALLIDSDGNRSLDIFEFEDGLIRREWEFLLGPGPDWTGQDTASSR